MYHKTNNSNQYRDFVKGLSLFKDVKKIELDSIVSNIKLKKYMKGETFPLNIEKRSRLYIIFMGQIKLIKINERGEELILRIVNKGDTLSSMHFSSFFDVSFEFLEDTSLLYLSEDIVNKFIKENNSFAKNIISMLSENIQSLMMNAEVWRLKNTKEKVGWFLNSININNFGKLSLSKSSIASYLGMTPESFSRALNKLSNEGIYLENNNVKQIIGNELCLYCDKVTGVNCEIFGTEECKHRKNFN